MLFVLDGDEYTTEQEKRKKIARVLTGTSPAYDAQRQAAFDRINDFILPQNAQPEAYFIGQFVH